VTVVRLFEAELAQFMRSANGPVALELTRLAVRVETQAKINATGSPNVQTGRYRSSISWRLGIDGDGLFAEVGSNVEYARFLEEGTPPHVIRPRAKRALFWPGARHPVKSVRHPGTRPYRVLQRALESVL
jgi:phage gpG-like protein